MKGAKEEPGLCRVLASGFSAMPMDIVFRDDFCPAPIHMTEASPRS